MAALELKELRKRGGDATLVDDRPRLSPGSSQRAIEWFNQYKLAIKHALQDEARHKESWGRIGSTFRDS